MFQNILIFSFGISVVLCGRDRFYRKDYTYFEDFDAFYKLHTDDSGLSWNTAFFGCEAEGSQLFYPRAPEEWVVVNNLIKAKEFSVENISHIYTGIRNEGIEEFLTIDGRPTPSPISNYYYDQQQTSRLCTTMDVQTGMLSAEQCENVDPVITSYVCKKVEDVLVSCPTIDHGYIYMQENKKCYKINKHPKSWYDALNTCVMEGGLLVNIEANNLLNLIDKGTLYHAGFRRIPPSEEYYNMKGQSVRDADRRHYYDQNEKYECGAILRENRNLYLRSLECHEKQPFVCEMDVQI